MGTARDRWDQLDNVGKSVFTSSRAGRKWKSAQLQHSDGIGFAEARWDSPHNCSAIVHGFRFLDKDAIAVSSKECLECTGLYYCLGNRLVKSLRVRIRRELSRRDIVASFIGLPDQKEVEPGKGKIAAFQYLQRGYQEKTGIGSTQRCIVGR